MKRISTKIQSIIALIILVLFCANFDNNSDPIINKWTPKNDVVEMPIVFDSKPNKNGINCSSPKEQRDEEFKDLLSASVKITVNEASGSGTICYYDSDENWAYVISCGHLWNGNKSYDSKSKNKAKIIIWYKNKKKLPEPEIYDAEVLFWSNERGYDCSCLRFRPDYKPNYFSIAQLEYKYKKGTKLNSLGCDGGSEVARYEVEFLEIRGLDIITIKNSPRPGRSGGGLITDNKLYIGICWGTSDTTSGGGIGYFTPIKSIHEVFTKNKHDWLLRMSNPIKNIPIYNWDENKEEKNLDFVPTPILARTTSF